jgi:hypothetical protein
MLGANCLSGQNVLAKPTQTTTLPTETKANSQENFSSTAEIDRSFNLPEFSETSAKINDAATAEKRTLPCPQFKPLTNRLAPNVSSLVERQDIQTLQLPTSSCAADLTEISSSSLTNQEFIVQENPPDSETESPSEFPSNSEEVQLNEENENDRWHFKLQPYATIPVTTYGNVTIEDQTVSYHLTTGQLLETLRVTASGRFEAWKGNLGLIVDGYYVSLSGAGIKQFSRLPNTNVQSTLKFDQGIYDFALSYHFGDSPPYSLPDKASNQSFPLIWFEPIAGVRLNDINASIQNTINLGTGPFNLQLQRTTRNQGRTWFEPMVGGKFGVQISEPITFWMRGDVSGFGIAGDTDLSWNFIAGVDWWVYRNISLQFAYRFYEIDYGNFRGGNDFSFQESFNGPFLSATFYF